MEDVILSAAFSAFFTTFLTSFLTSSSSSESSSSPGVFVFVFASATSSTDPRPLPATFLRSFRRRTACLRNASWIIPAAIFSRRSSSPIPAPPRCSPASVSKSVRSVRLSKSVAVTSVSVARRRLGIFGAPPVTRDARAPAGIPPPGLFTSATIGEETPSRAPPAADCAGSRDAVPTRCALKPDPGRRGCTGTPAFGRRTAPEGPPYRLMFERLAARDVSEMYAAMPPCPFAAARSAAVYPPAPQRAVARMFAPEAKSVATVSSWPFAAAQCSAVRCRRSGWFTSHPLLHMAGMAQFMPNAATQ